MADVCPGSCSSRSIADCPLYQASHDPDLADLGCVLDLAQPCRVAQGESFDDLFNKVIERVLYG